MNKNFYLLLVILTSLVGCTKEADEVGVTIVPSQHPTYQTIASTKYRHLEDAHYFDENNALWLVSYGSSSKVLKQEGSGYNDVFTITNEIPSEIEMADEDNGFIVTAGHPGKLYATTDGGLHWEHVFTADYYIVDLQVVSKDVLFLLCSSTIYKSVDGGRTWQVSLPQSFEPSPSKIYFYNDQIGFIGHSEDGLIKKTTDGGKTWTTSNLPTIQRVYSMFFLDEMKGFATTAYDENLYGTENGGETWSKIGKGDFYGLQQVFFYPDGRGIVTAQSHMTYYSKDFGKTFTLFLNGTGENGFPDGEITAINDSTLIIPYSQQVFKINFPKN